MGQYRRVLPALMLMLASFAAGCQSAATPDILESAAAPQDAESAPSALAQTVGTGPVALALFIDGSLAGSANDYRDGAALALNELGAGHLTLTVHDLRASGADAGALVKQASDNGAKLLIGSPSLVRSEAVKSVAGNDGLVAMVLASEAPPASFAIVSDEVDGAIEIAAYAVGAGRKKMMVVTTRSLSAADMQRLRQGMKTHGAELLDIVSDPASAEGAAKLQKLGEAQAVLLIGTDAPRVVAPALRERGGLPADVPFLGSFVWPAQAYGEPALEGSLLAMIDQGRLKRISGRFQSTYGRPLSMEAAYAFDVVATAAGIVRSKGGEGLKPAVLRDKAGFSGSTGIFRFGPDGRVERRFAIYRIKSGKLVLQDDTPASF